MRVLSGRLKAVLVALLAAIAAHRRPRADGHPRAAIRPVWPASCTPSGRSNRAATTPPGTRRRARTASTRSCPSSWRAWADRYLGDPNAQADAGQPGDRGHGQGARAVRRPRQLATRRLLVADRLEPDQRLVDLRDALRDQGHGLLRERRSDRCRRPAAARGRRRAAAPALLGGEPDDRLQRRRGESARVLALRGWRGRVRDEGRGDGHVHVHRVARHLVRPGRTDPRPGPGLRRRQAGQRRSTCIAARSPPARRCSARRGPRPASTRSSSRSSGRAGHPYVAIDEFVVGS